MRIALMITLCLGTICAATTFAVIGRSKTKWDLRLDQIRQQRQVKIWQDKVRGIKGLENVVLKMKGEEIVMTGHTFDMQL